MHHMMSWLLLNILFSHSMSYWAYRDGSGTGRLLFHKSKARKIRRYIRKEDTLTLGGLACLARAAMTQQGQKLQFFGAGTSAKRLLLGLPEKARGLLAVAFAGKVRGRLVAAAWAGDSLPDSALTPAISNIFTGALKIYTCLAKIGSL